LLYRDGILVFRQPGYFSEDQLEDIVRQAESLDMNEVRSHIASDETGQNDQNQEEGNG
jgi:thioredoxin 1